MPEADAELIQRNFDVLGGVLGSILDTLKVLDARMAVVEEAVAVEPGPNPLADALRDLVVTIGQQINAMHVLTAAVTDQKDSALQAAWVDWLEGLAVDYAGVTDRADDPSRLVEWETLLDERPHPQHGSGDSAGE